jgi:hypothetical protein
MGIFNKLFGTPVQEENKLVIRAQFKNEHFFRKSLKIWDEVFKGVEEDNEKYIAEHGALTSNHYRSYCHSYNKKTAFLYCLGYSKSDIEPVFLLAVENFSKGWDDNFSGTALLVDMAAKSVLFDIPQPEFQKVKDFMFQADQSKIKEMWKPPDFVNASP